MLTAPEQTISRRAEALVGSRWLRHSGLVFGGLVLFLMIAMAVFAPLISPYDPYKQDLLARTVPPAWMDGGSPSHPLGTDGLGRDYLTRLIYGARISIGIGLIAAFISGLIGITLGMIAGFFGGRVDAIISFFVTARLATPIILVALAVVAMYGPSFGIVVTVLGLLLWDRYALVTRAATQQIRNSNFVVASRVAGASRLQTIFYEILPNLVGPLTVVATFEVAQAIVLEAALSFLGLGVPPPLPSWGLMMAEGKANILFDPWLILLPGGLLFVLVLAANLAGDGLRDMAAPESRN